MTKIKTLLMATLVAMMALGTTSCDDEYDYRDIAGCWELYADEVGPVNEYDVDKYYFYEDGSGTYGYYDHGEWVGDVTFVWSFSGDHSICVDFGRGERYYYYVDMRGRSLYLSEYPDFYTYLQYLPARH